MENESLGSRKIPFGKELYIGRDDFMIDPPKNNKELFLGTEVRLMNAYFVTCTALKLMTTELSEWFTVPMIRLPKAETHRTAAR